MEDLYNKSKEELINKNIRLQKEIEALKFELSTLKEQMKDLNYVAYKDTLTDSYNRRGMYKYISETENKDYWLVNLDLDNFKSINDELGHDAGDYVLTQIVSVMKRIIRSNDTVVRYGGDEFYILFEQTVPLDTIIKRVDIIREFIINLGIKVYNQYDRVPKVGKELSISAGIIDYNSTKDVDNYINQGIDISKLKDFSDVFVDFANVKRLSDISLYECKNNNKSQTCISSSVDSNKQLKK